MQEIIIFGVIVGLFFVWLLVKQLTNSQLCAICASVSTTWLGLLALRFMGLFENNILLALLMGASVTGGYYWLARIEKLQLFKLPMLLTLAVGAYSIALLEVRWELILFVVGVWILFGTFALFRGRGEFVKKIIECCKNW